MGIFIHVPLQHAQGHIVVPAEKTLDLGDDSVIGQMVGQIMLPTVIGRGWNIGEDIGDGSMNS
uniref:Uncharacterized protein n=1 Tax=Candidatus Kentrum sp. LFY TaxID=2126342 RepID=A0A450UW07_9GAMM|nr:MAG: hypothetical protein BECKLFY1418A_GA0070994_106211 [Candidatus Kentron sp. LFY]